MNIAYDGTMDPRAFKDVFGALIPRLAEQRDDFIYLDADLMNCVGTWNWAKQHPERAVNCGVAEANMMGVAAGLSAAGFTPVVHTFAAFASRRAFDQVFLSAGYAKNSVTVVGSDPGVLAAFNGGTHMPFEDMALYRTIPGATVIDCCDTAMLESVLPQCLDRPGVKYLRMPRKQLPKVYPDGAELPVGKAITLREGTDVAIFCCGLMVHEAMRAAEILAQTGVQAVVVDMFTVKPLDVDAVVRHAGACGAVVVAENHNRVGGLASAVCDALAARCPVPVECVAVQDRFGEVGPQEYLQEQFGLTAANVAEKARAVLTRKNRL